MAEIKGTGGDIYVQRLLWEEEDGNIKHLNICVAFSTRPKWPSGLCCQLGKNGHAFKGLEGERSVLLTSILEE